MLIEVVLGFVFAFAIIIGAIFFAFRPPKLNGPSRHHIRGGGDHANEHNIDFGGGDAGGGGD